MDRCTTSAIILILSCIVWPCLRVGCGECRGGCGEWSRVNACRTVDDVGSNIARLYTKEIIALQRGLLREGKGAGAYTRPLLCST